MSLAQLTVVPALKDLVRPAAAWLGMEVRKAITERGRCALALAGGRTPEPVYRELAGDPVIDWEKVELFFGDERAVPPDHPESNYYMVRRALLSRVALPPDRVHRMEADRADLEQAARDYERALPPHLDVLVLGIGADGHTASLFPGSATLDERLRLVVPAHGPTPPVQRLTITPPVIEAARRVAVIATGEPKAAMVARAIEGPWTPREVPAQLAREGHWFLDQAAAAGLTVRSGAT
jgi:6-phosphogluconolactonase